MEDKPKLNIAVDFDLLKVLVYFPSGDVSIFPFTEIQEFALEDHDLTLCPTLLRKGKVRKKQITYILTG